MKKTIIKFFVVFVMIFQMIPGSFTNVIAADNNMLDSDLINFATENEADNVVEKDLLADFDENAKLNVEVQLNGESKTTKVLTYFGEKQPGKLMVTALKGYQIVSITLNDRAYANDDILFEREVGDYHKTIVIAVTEESLEKRPTLVKNDIAPQASDDTANKNGLYNQNAKYFILRKGQSKAVGNASDPSYKYFQYGTGSLRSDVKQYNILSNGGLSEVLNDYLGTTPEKTSISKENYCKINNTYVTDCDGLDTEEYEIEWYRTKKESDGWHVDGYVVEKKKITIMFELQNPGAKDWDLLSTVSIFSGNKLDSWPTSTPEISEVNNKRYEFSGWYNDPDLTTKASLDTVYTGDAGSKVMLYAKYIELSPLQLSMENKIVEYDGDPHSFGNITTTLDGEILKDVELQYSLDGGENWKTGLLPTYVNANEEGNQLKVRTSYGKYGYSNIVDASLKIKKAQLTITPNKSGKAYGKKDPTLTATISGLKGSDLESVYTYTLARSVGEDVGVYTISINGEDEIENYKIVKNTNEFSITAIDAVNLILNFKDKTVDYNGTKQSLDLPSVQDKQSKTTYQYRILYENGKGDWLDEMPTFKNAGTYTVEVKATNTNYDDDVYETATLTIHKLNLNIKVDSQSKVFGEKEEDAMVSVNGLLEIDKASLEYEISRETGNDIGTYTYKVDVDKYDSTNYNLTIDAGILEITKAPGSLHKLTLENVTALYDGEKHSLENAKTEVKDSIILYSVDKKTWTEEMPSFTDAGLYSVYVKATNANYEDSNVYEATVLINKREITLTAASGSKVFDGTPLSIPEYVISEGTLAEKQTLKVTLEGMQTTIGTSTNHISNVEIVKGEKDVTSNYVVTLIDGKLSVSEMRNPVAPTTPNTPNISDMNVPTVSNPFETTVNEAALIQPLPVTSTPSLTPVEKVESKETAKSEGEEIVKDNSTPKAANEGTWALLNLLCAGATLVLAIFLWLFKKNKEESEDGNIVTYKHKLWLKVAMRMMAVVSIVGFILTEDMTLKMIFMDKWTTLMIGLLVVQIVFFITGKVCLKETEEESMNE